MSEPEPAEIGECFFCVGQADTTYPLVFHTGKTVEDKLICGVCWQAFQDLDWIEVAESPIVFRGGIEDLPD